MDIRFTIPTSTYSLDLALLKQAGVNTKHAPMYATVAYVQLGELTAHRKSLFLAYDGELILEYELPEPTVSPLSPSIVEDRGGKAVAKLILSEEVYITLVRTLFFHLSPSQYMDAGTKRALEASTPMIWANYIDLLSMCMEGVSIVVGQNETAENGYALPGFTAVE